MRSGGPRRPWRGLDDAEPLKAAGDVALPAYAEHHPELVSEGQGLAGPTLCRLPPTRNQMRSAAGFRIDVISIEHWSPRQAVT